MSDGKLNIDGLDELIKKIDELKSGLSESVDSLGKMVKAVDGASKAELNAAKTLTETAKQNAINAKAENDSILAKQKIEKAAISLKKATEQLTQEQKLLQKINESEAGSYNQLSAQMSLNQIRLKAMSEETRKNTKYGQELEQETADLNNKLKALDDTVGISTRKVGDYALGTISLRQEMKQLTVELVQMKLRGEEDSDTYKKMAQRLGDIKDSMSDVANEAKVLGSDTRSIDMAVGSVEAFGSAAQVTEGTMQLLGSQNEDVMKGVQRLTAIQGIMNGVQQIGNALQKESAFMMGLHAAQSKIAAAGQGLYSLAVGTSTGAMKAFRIALLATGIGALIVGIGLLVANWDKLSAAISGGADALNKYNKANSDALTINSIKNSMIDKEIELLKAKGATDDQIALKEQEKISNNIQGIEDQIKAIEDLKKSKESDLAKSKELTLKNIALNILTLGEAQAYNAFREKSTLNEILGLDNKTKVLKTNLNEQRRLLLVAQTQQSTDDKKAKDKDSEDEKKKYEAKLKAQNDYWSEVRKLGKSDLELENINYAERLNKAFVFGQDLNNLNADEKAIYEQLEKDHLARIAEIHAKADDEERERLNKKFEEQSALQEKIYQNEYTDLVTQLTNKEITQKDFDTRSQDVELGNLLWKKDLLINAGKDTTEIDAQIADFKLNRQKQTNAAILASDIDLINKKKEARMIELDMIQGISETIGALAKKDSALAIAAFAVQKALAIARVWVQTAASNAIITAEAGAAAIPTLGASILGGISLITANNIMAGIQTGLIAAQSVAELKGFAKGTNDAPGGLAFVGEKGREIITLPDGSKYLTPDVSTLINLPKHSEVTPNHLVENELREVLKMENVSNASDNSLMLELISVIKSKPSASFSINSHGISVMAKKGQSTTKWLNSTYRGVC